jgi:hypothetical protein
MDEIDRHHMVTLRGAIKPGAAGCGSPESARPKSRPRPKGVWCTALAAAGKEEASYASNRHDAEGEGRAPSWQRSADPACPCSRALVRR